MYVKFWGVRGSIPTPGPRTVRYGGNTSCVEVRPENDQLIILDGGSGLRELGRELLAENFGRGEGEASLFFSHTHWDHIQGFPFFSPAYVKARGDGGGASNQGRRSNVFNIFGKMANGKKIEEILDGQMQYHFFPVELGALGSELNFHRMEDGQETRVGKTLVRAYGVTHPGGCLSFRIQAGKKTVVYCTDYEHDCNGIENSGLIEHCTGADLLIYDCCYSEEEYRNGKVGFGHSTPEEGIKVARAAGVKQFVMFHFDPLHDDDFVATMEDETRKLFANSCAAREGLVIRL